MDASQHSCRSWIIGRIETSETLGHVFTFSTSFVKLCTGFLKDTRTGQVDINIIIIIIITEYCEPGLSGGNIATMSDSIITLATPASSRQLRQQGNMTKATFQRLSTTHRQGSGVYLPSFIISSSHYMKMRRSEGRAVSRCSGGASSRPWPERERGEVQFMHFAAQLSEADI